MRWISSFLTVFSLLVNLTLFSNEKTQEHYIVRRVAFDIGSGLIKMQVSDVDLSVNKIVNVLFRDSANIPLREDLAHSLDSSISLPIQNKLITAISDLMKKTAPFHPEQYHAIATESLRLAKNGLELTKKIEELTGIPVSIISQEEEGILGFISAINEFNIDPTKAVSWDFGGGSFQITTKLENHYCVYQGRLGKVPTKMTLLKVQGKAPNESPNPVSYPDVAKTIQCIQDNIKDIPNELYNKLQDPEVVILGIGINPLWIMGKCSHYNKDHILKEIHYRLHLDDTAMLTSIHSLETPPLSCIPYIISNLTLAYAVMEAFSIPQVHYVGTEGGNAAGALLSSKYWQTQTINIKVNN